jgi:predicted PurR-regulated permease PerM
VSSFIAGVAPPLPLLYPPVTSSKPDDGLPPSVLPRGSLGKPHNEMGTDREDKHVIAGADRGPPTTPEQEKAAVAEAAVAEVAAGAFASAGGPPSGAAPDRQRRRVVRVAGWAALVVIGIVIALLLAYHLLHFLIIVFIAIIVAAAIYPAAAWLERRRLPRVLAVLIPYILILAFLGLLGFLIVPPLVQQVRSFVNALPDLIADVERMIADLLHRFGVGSGTTSSSVASELRRLIPSINTLLRLPLTVFSVIGDLLIIVISSILMLIERNQIARWIGNLLPTHANERFQVLAAQSIKKVGRYVLGQLAIMVIVGIGTALVMFALGLPFALPMGVLGFVGEIVPYLGPIVAGVPAAIIGFVHSTTDGLIMGGWLILLHILEAYVLGPQIQHRVLRISPLAVVLVVVVALSLLGILGGLVAIPFLAVVDIILQNIVFPWRARRNSRIAG